MKTRNGKSGGPVMKVGSMTDQPAPVAKRMISHPYVTEQQWGEYCGVPSASLLPKINVTALEADAYCKWAGGRLPTSDELEGQFCPLWEWTSTMEGGLRVLRGGSFYFDAGYLRAADRYGNEPDVRSDSIGFRSVREDAHV